jgi:hypothetical protein
MLGLGMAIGMFIGLVSATVLMRYALGLGEKIAWAAKEGRPVFSEYEPAIQQSHTDGTTDLEEIEP